MPNLIYTRPIKRGLHLEEEISLNGFNIIRIPCIDFVYNFETLSKLEDLKTFDYYIFPSITSIESVFEYLKKNNIDSSFLNHKSISVGKGSYQKLIEHNIQNPIFPKTGTTSENMLELEPFKKGKNKSFLLFRGDVSREYITQILKTKDADFNEITVYKTIKAKNLDNSINKINDLNLDDQNIILFTSKSIIDFFLNSANANLKKNLFSRLKDFIIIVPSARLEKYAKLMGFSVVYNSNQMTNSAILNTLRKINN